MNEYYNFDIITSVEIKDDTEDIFNSKYTLSSCVDGDDLLCYRIDEQENIGFRYGEVFKATELEAKNRFRKYVSDKLLDDVSDVPGTDEWKAFSADCEKFFTADANKSH